MTEQLVGQLYQIKTVARHSCGVVEKCTFVVHAHSREAAVEQLRAAQHDQAHLVQFRVLFCEKVKRVHRIHSLILGNDESLSAPLERPTPAAADFSVGSPAQLPGGTRRLFGLAIAGQVNARDYDHVLRIIGNFLLRRGLNQPVTNPLADGGAIAVDPHESAS